MPTLASMTGGPITTVAPTTTATALSSIATGLTPAEHGLLGYRMMIGGEVLNVLRWNSAGGDRRRVAPAARRPAVRRRSSATTCPVDLAGRAGGHRRSPRPTCAGRGPVGWRAASAIAVEVGRQLRAGERFVYAYYGGIDKTAHERGFGEFYDAELRFADRLVADVLDALPPGAVLLVTADHGQVDVGDRHHRARPRRCWRWSPQQSGEGRFRWWHARRGAADELADGGRRALRRRGLGRHPRADHRRALVRADVAPPIAARLGDVALVAHAPVSFHDPADSGPFELVCRHGSLTAAEVLVPLARRRPVTTEKDRPMTDLAARDRARRAGRAAPSASSRRRADGRARARRRRHVAGQGDAHRLDGQDAARGGAHGPARRAQPGAAGRDLRALDRRAVRGAVAGPAARAEDAGPAVPRRRDPDRGRDPRRQGPARRLARGPVPRHPGHAVRPAAGRPPAARADPPAPARRARRRRRSRHCPNAPARTSSQLARSTTRSAPLPALATAASATLDDLSSSARAERHRLVDVAG